MTLQFNLRRPVDRLLLVGLIFSIVATGCERAPSGTPVETVSHKAPPLPVDSVDVADTTRRLVSRYQDKRSLHREPGYGTTALAATPSNEFSGYFGPRVVESHDGRFALYNSWLSAGPYDSTESWADQGITEGSPIGTPVIRLIDFTTGLDSVFADAAYAPAISREGRIAFARGKDASFKAGHVYFSDIFVQSSLSSQPVKWTSTEGHYVVAAWARDTLLAYRVEDDRNVLLALRGPGQESTLKAGGELAAIDASGSHALVVDGRHLPGIYPAETAVQLLVIDGGRSIATASAGELVNAGVLGFYPGGEWLGNLAVLPGRPGPVVLRVERDRIELVQVVGLDSGRFPHGAQFARFGTGTSDTIEAWTSSPVPGTSGRRISRDYETRSLTCDRANRTCTASTPLAPLDVSPIANPSRPGRS